MLEHELGDDPLSLSQHSSLRKIRASIHPAPLKLLTVMKMYLMGKGSIEGHGTEGWTGAHHWKMTELKNGPKNRSAIHTHGRKRASSPPVPRWLEIEACH